MGCRPASAPSNVVASFPVPSDAQDCTASCEVDEEDAGEKEDNEEGKNEQNNYPPNEGI